MKSHALSWAQQQRPVFPLANNGKRPRITSWPQRATTDPETISGWWDEWPQAGVGGTTAGWLVVDVDPRNGGSLPEGLPPTRIHASGRGDGGQHWIYAAPDWDAATHKANGKLAEGVDLKAGPGSYIVLPPTLHPATGQPYTVECDRDPAPAPEWLLDKLRRPSRPQTTGTVTPIRREASGGTAWAAAALSRELATLATTAEGGRNNQLNACAFNLGQLVGAGELAEQTVREQLADVATDIGLEPDEIRQSIDSGLGAGMADPRSAPNLDHVMLVQRRLAQLRADREARELLAAETATQILDRLPPVRTAAELLAAELEVERWLVEDLWPGNGTVLLAAPNKAGKSTMVGGLVRCLIDGGAFLGHFDTAPDPQRRVALVDTELSESMLQDWLRGQDIRGTDRIIVETLRGRAGVFNLAVPAIRAEWVQRLRGVDVLILDCLSPVLAAAGLEERTEGSRILREGVATLQDEAGIKHALVVHHTGHEGTRSRGDSGLMDWPDALWTLQRPEGHHGPRVFEAFGRGVDQPLRRIDYDRVTRQLTLDPDSTVVPSLGHESRKQASADRRAETEEQLVEWLREQHADTGTVPGRRAAQAWLKDQELSPRYSEFVDPVLEAVSREVGDGA